MVLELNLGKKHERELDDASNYVKKKYLNKDGTLNDRGLKKYKRLGDKDEVVAKGTTAYRSTSGKDGHKEIEKGHAYLSTDKKEAEEYAQALGLMAPNKNTYVLQYKTKEALVSPSEKKRIDSFVELMQDAKMKDAIVKNIKRDTQGKGRAGMFTDRFKSEKRISKDLDRISKGYVTAKDQRKLSNLLMTEPNVRDAYFKNIKDKGYNALADDNDRNNGMGKTAIIALDRSKSLQLGRQWMYEMAATDSKGNLRKDYREHEGDFENDMSKYLKHHGIKGMRWGIRRWQNEDGSLTAAGKKHYDKADAKWAKRNNDKLIAKTQKKVSKEMRKFEKELSRQPGFRNANGKISKNAINAYNRKMAQAMNNKIGEVKSPSGRVVKFVAKRGEIGVQMALADPSYDMGKVANGVWANGRVAYKSQELNKINI